MGLHSSRRCELWFRPFLLQPLDLLWGEGGLLGRFVRVFLLVQCRWRAAGGTDGRELRYGSE